jgi:hypothetical protein
MKYYINIYSGWIREEGDEVRHIYVRYWLDDGPDYGPGPWEPVKLIGWPILRSDLMHLEFRRPV